MVLFVDIETFGDQPEPKELIPPTRDDVKLGNIKDPVKIEAKIEIELPKLIAAAKKDHKEAYDKEWRGNALKSLKSSIIAIAWAFDDEPVVSIGGHDEFELLFKFNAALEAVGSQVTGATVVAHNGIGFDFPYLRHRAFKYNFSLINRVFDVNRYSPRMGDTQEIWRGSDFKTFYSMDAIATYLGIEGKTGITGKDVHDYYLAGLIDSITEYCGHDVEVLRNVWNRLNFK